MQQGIKLAKHENPEVTSHKASIEFDPKSLCGFPAKGQAAATVVAKCTRVAAVWLNVWMILLFLCFSS